MAELCVSHRWKNWAGYYTVCAYDTNPDREYFAFRHAAGLIDVTPLFKYDVKGPDAAAYLSFLTVKDASKLAIGQVTYTCWCDDRGKLIDDGTVSRLGENEFRVTAAEPSYGWFTRYARGFNVTIEDVSQKNAALSLQGPNSREILKKISDARMDELKFFRFTKTKIEGKGGPMSAIISRTGYTGDLGYEIWVDSADALKLWDSLMVNGRAHGIEAAGLDAMDITRIEAGFIMNGVDYTSANHCLVERRMSTPFEANLGWTVQLERDLFVGQAALQKEKREGSQKAFVGLDISWEEIEALFGEYHLPPEVPTAAWRTSIPVYDFDGREQVGYASSGAWSPTLKKNLALATVSPEHAEPGTQLKFEITVEHKRRQVSATVTKTPFFNPARKTFTPAFVGAAKGATAGMTMGSPKGADRGLERTSV